MIFSNEPHLPYAAEDQPCTGCGGSGKQMFATGPDVCVSCDGTGSGYREWLNENTPEPKEAKTDADNT